MQNDHKNYKKELSVDNDFDETHSSKELRKSWSNTINSNKETICSCKYTDCKYLKSYKILKFKLEIMEKEKDKLLHGKIMFDKIENDQEKFIEQNNFFRMENENLKNYIKTIQIHQKELDIKIKNSQENIKLWEMNYKKLEIQIAEPLRDKNIKLLIENENLKLNFEKTLREKKILERKLKYGFVFIFTTFLYILFKFLK